MPNKMGLIAHIFMKIVEGFARNRLIFPCISYIIKISTAWVITVKKYSTLATQYNTSFIFHNVDF